MCYKRPGDTNKKASTVSHLPQAAVVGASCLSITRQLPIQIKWNKTAVMFFCVKPTWLKFIETTFNNIYLFIDSCGSPSIHGNLGQMQQQWVVIHQVKILVRTTYVFRLFACICDLFSVLSIWQAAYTGCSILHSSVWCLSGGRWHILCLGSFGAVGRTVERVGSRCSKVNNCPVFLWI